MTELLQPVRLVDVAIAWIVLEGIVVFVRHFKQGQSPLAWWSMTNAAAGLMLLLTARAALTSPEGAWVILCLGGALLAHLCEWAARSRLPLIDKNTRPH